jgi:hypothetical protein
MTKNVLISALCVAVSLSSVAVAKADDMGHPMKKHAMQHHMMMKKKMMMRKKMMHHAM